LQPRRAARRCLRARGAARAGYRRPGAGVEAGPHALPQLPLWFCISATRNQEHRLPSLAAWQSVTTKVARRPDSAPLAGPALSPPAPREWHCPSGRNSHEWRERLAQCRNMCTQLGPSLIITERGRHYGAGGQPPHTFILPHEAIPPYSQHTWNSVKPPLFLQPTAAS
jgi:hypothetical protein